MATAEALPAKGVKPRASLRSQAGPLALRSFRPDWVKLEDLMSYYHEPHTKTDQGFRTSCALPEDASSLGASPPGPFQRCSPESSSIPQRPAGSGNSNWQETSPK